MGSEIFSRAVELLHSHREFPKPVVIGENLAVFDCGYFYYLDDTYGPRLIVQVDMRSGSQLPCLIGKALAPLSCEVICQSMLLENDEGKVRVHNVEHADFNVCLVESGTCVDIADFYACPEDSESARKFSAFVEEHGIEDWVW